MVDSDEVIHVEEAVLVALWDLIHEAHKGDIGPARFCSQPACLALRGIMMDSSICGGEGNDDD